MATDGEVHWVVDTYPIISIKSATEGHCENGKDTPEEALDELMASDDNDSNSDDNDSD